MSGNGSLVQFSEKIDFLVPKLTPEPDVVGISVSGFFRKCESEPVQWGDRQVDIINVFKLINKAI